MSSSDGNHATSHVDDAHGEDAHGEDHGPPPPPEPHTPMWLPAVGAVLFLGVGLIWALSTPAKDPTETLGSPVGTVVSAAAPAQTAPSPNGLAPRRGGTLPPGH
jgi:hypothetical protein